MAIPELPAHAAGGGRGGARPRAAGEIRDEIEQLIEIEGAGLDRQRSDSGPDRSGDVPRVMSICRPCSARSRSWQNGDAFALRNDHHVARERASAADDLDAIQRHLVDRDDVDVARKSPLRRCRIARRDGKVGKRQLDAGARQVHRARARAGAERARGNPVPKLSVFTRRIFDGWPANVIQIDLNAG